MTETTPDYLVIQELKIALAMCMARLAKEIGVDFLECRDREFISWRQLISGKSELRPND